MLLFCPETCPCMHGFHVAMLLKVALCAPRFPAHYVLPRDPLLRVEHHGLTALPSLGMREIPFDLWFA
jgi:hypothetical protein